jgi:hypothetical protein
MISADDMRPRVHHSDEGDWLFACPGCNCLHAFNHNYSFNGDVVRPTFLPSLLFGAVTAGVPGVRRCHFYVAEGRIQFLADCTHTLAGTTVDMEPWQ